MTDTVDDFLQRVAGRQLRLVAADRSPPPRAPERVDALFHLPLLGLAIMVIARRDRLVTAEVGRKVAHLLVEHFSGLRDAERTLEWSGALRRRTAEALAFLEAARLSVISSNDERVVTLSPAGRALLERARARDTTDVGELVRALVRASDRVFSRRGGQ